MKEWENYKNEYAGILRMGANVISGKILGLSGMLAAIIYIIALFVTAFTTSGFEIGVNNISELGSQTIYMLGCIVAGILGVVYGVGVILQSKDSGVFISKIRGLFLILAAIVLIILGATKSDSTVIMAFEILAIIAVVCEIADYWVSEEKIKMVITAFFAIVMIVTASLNLIVGFGFALFAALWILIMGFFVFAEACQPVVAAPKLKSKSDKSEAKSSKKSAEKTKQAPVKSKSANVDKKKVKPVVEPAKPKEEKKQEPVKAASVKDQPKEVPKEQPKEEPKKAEVSNEVLKEVPKEQPKEESKKEPLPKLKVMSSREAAAARLAKKEASVEEPASVEESKVAEIPVESVSAPEKTIESEPVEEPVVVSEIQSMDEDVEDSVPMDQEELEEEFEIEPDTPDALVRRAAWNKGLRCRRDYGEHAIPVAFVKGKVAVFVTAEEGDTSIDEVLISEGWTVLRYLEKDVTDGKIQGDEIAKTVKENLKAERAAKKKKKTAKR